MGPSAGFRWLPAAERVPLGGCATRLAEPTAKCDPFWVTPHLRREALRLLHNEEMTVCQMGVQVFRLLLQYESRIGEQARAALRGTQHTVEDTERRRDVLPLPLPNGGYYIEKLFAYLNDPRGSQKSMQSAERASFRWDVAVGAWTMSQVLLVNYLHSDRGYLVSKGRCDAPRYTSAQQEAVERMEEAAIYLCSREGSDLSAPRVAWKNEVKAVSFAYDEVVSRPEKITWAQVEAGLPPAAQCGSLKAVDFCSGPVRASLEAVDQYVLPLEEWPEVSQATVHCDDDEWDLVTAELLDRGILAIVEEKDIPVIHGNRLGNGAFGVRKSGDAPPGHDYQLRLIANLTPTNAGQTLIMGDLDKLPLPGEYCQACLDG